MAACLRAMFSGCLAIAMIALSGGSLVSSLGTVSTGTAHFTLEGRVVERLYNSSGHLHECYVYGDRNAAEKVLAATPRENKFLMKENIFQRLAKDCFALSTPLRARTRNKRQIFPGTKWCGAGNIASAYDDLGDSTAVDKCCRAHDHCPISIKASHTKYGLKNNLEYSLTGCSCDTDFYACLKKVNSDVSELIASIFYSVLDGQCVENSRPLKCSVGWWWKKTCKPDLSKPKKWRIKKQKISFESLLG